MRILNNGSWLVPYDDLMRATDYIRQNTAPNDIVFLSDEVNRDLSITIAFFSQRRIDKGAWEETQPSNDKLAYLRERAKSYRGKACYVALKDSDLPGDTLKTAFGNLHVGLRQVPSAKIQPK